MLKTHSTGVILSYFKLCITQYALQVINYIKHKIDNMV